MIVNIYDKNKNQISAELKFFFTNYIACGSISNK